MLSPVRRASLIEIGVFLALLAGMTLVLAGAFRAPGSEFDEGILVTFPDRMLHGALPYRDFETFYGPANAGVVALVFKVFGPSLVAERAVGLVFRLLLVVTLFLLGRRFGWMAAGCSGLIGAVLISQDLAANAEFEALALALLALVAAAQGISTRSSPERWLFAAGLVGGSALLFRLELLPGVVLSAVPLLVPAPRRARLLWGTGFLAALATYVPFGVLAGTGRLHRSLSDLLQTGRDRRLPLPALASASGRLFVLTLLASALLVTAGAWLVRSRQHGLRGHLVLAGGILAVCQLSIALWRADNGHIVVAAVVPLSLLPVSLAAVGDRLVSGRLLVVGATGVILAVCAANPPIRGNDFRNLMLTLGRRTPGALVVVNGRSFRIESARAARDLQSVLNVLKRRAANGERLFVGPQDLRRLNMNDVFVYYEFPRLRPASYYLEVDPPLSRPNSPLPRDLAHADYLVLTTRWNAWSERNASRRYGSAAPNEVVRRLFCTIARAGTYELLHRCHSA